MERAHHSPYVRLLTKYCDTYLSVIKLLYIIHISGVGSSVRKFGDTFLVG